MRIQQKHLKQTLFYIYIYIYNSQLKPTQLEPKSSKVILSSKSYNIYNSILVRKFSISSRKVPMTRFDFEVKKDPKRARKEKEKSESESSVPDGLRSGNGRHEMTME